MAMSFEERLKRAKSIVNNCREEAKRQNLSTAWGDQALTNAVVAIDFAIIETAKKSKTSVDDGGAD